MDSSSFDKIEKLYSSHVKSVEKFATQVGKGMNQDTYDKLVKKSLAECQLATEKILNSPNNFNMDTFAAIQDNTISPKVDEILHLKSTIEQIQSEVSFNKALINYLQRPVAIASSSTRDHGKFHLTSNKIASSTSSSFPMLQPVFDLIGTKRPRENSVLLTNNGLTNTSTPSEIVVVVEDVVTDGHSTSINDVVQPQAHNSVADVTGVIHAAASVSSIDTMLNTDSVTGTAGLNNSDNKAINLKEIKVTKGSEGTANKILQSLDIEEQIQSNALCILNHASTASDKFVSVQFIRILLKSKQTPMHLLDKYKVTDGLVDIILNTTTDEVLLERTLVCLCHILEYTRPDYSQRIAYAISLHVLPRLVYFLSRSDIFEEVQRDVLSVLIQICSDVNKESCLKVLECRPVPALLKIAAYPVTPTTERILQHNANLLRIMSMHIGLTLNVFAITPHTSATDASSNVIYNTILIMLQSKDSVIQNNACRTLYHTLLSTIEYLQHAPKLVGTEVFSIPRDKKIASIFNFQVEQFMKSQGIVLTVLHLFQFAVSTVIQCNAVICLNLLIKILPIEHIHILLSHFQLVRILCNSLGIVQSSTTTEVIKKYQDVLRCILELMHIDRTKVHLVGVAITYVKLFRTQSSDYETRRIAGEILSLKGIKC